MVEHDMSDAQSSDPAEWSSASYERHPEEDIEPRNSAEFLVGFIKDSIRRKLPPLDANRGLIMEAVDIGLQEALANGWESEASKETLEAISEMLHYLKDTPSTRVFCYAILMILGRVEMSETELAKKLGRTKAHVSKIKTTVQDHYGITSNCGRGDAARKLFASKRIDSVLKPTERQKKSWTGTKFLYSGLKPSGMRLPPSMNSTTE